MTDRNQMEAVIEAILFVSNDPVSRSKLMEVFGEKEQEAASEAVEAVVERYREDAERGVMIDEVAGGLRLVSRPDLHGYLRRFFEITGTNKLSMPALETLAIVAYRQPVTAPEIQELRGVSSSGVLKTLLERRLIRIAGRKEVVGKPFLYASTREFLQHFGLKSLKELPPLEQFEELFGGDVEAAPEHLEPDPEEEIEQQVATLDDQVSEAMDQAEADAIDAERAAAEEAEEVVATDTEVESSEEDQEGALDDDSAEAKTESDGEEQEAENGPLAEDDEARDVEATEPRTDVAEEPVESEGER